MKNESRRQKTSISVMKRVFSGILAVAVVLICSIGMLDTIASAAVSMDGHFVNAVVSDYTSGTLQSDGASNIYGNLFFGSTNQNIGFCTIGGRLYGISNSTTDFATLNSGTVITWNVNTSVTLEGETYYYGYNDINSSVLIGGDNFQDYAYTNINNAIAAYAQYAPGPPPETGNTLNISLPAGNVAIIEMGNGSNPVTLSTTTADPYPAPNSNINGKAILQTDTLPSVVSSSMQGATYITWSGTGGTTINGWYYTWSNTFDQVFDYHKYMIVINPLYGISSGGTVANSRIDINVTKALSYQIVPLDTAITSEGLVGNDSGVVYDGTYDPDSGEWSLVDEEGNPVEPTVGGGNIVQGTANTIHDFLQNIANEISGFFTGAIGAINTLVNAVSNFAGTLKALYIWLPAPVYSVLTAAIILAITIGVIKVFI